MSADVLDGPVVEPSCAEERVWINAVRCFARTLCELGQTPGHHMNSRTLRLCHSSVSTPVCKIGEALLQFNACCWAHAEPEK